MHIFSDTFVCLFVLMLSVQVNYNLVVWGVSLSSWMAGDQVAQKHNPVPSIRVEPATPRYRVIHSTPLQVTRGVAT